MEPGRVYSAPSLAARFHVSATPVREALLDLTKEGLVESVRNKGFRVTEVTDKQLDDIAELRALIEVPMVTRIASGITARQVRALRPLADSICSAAEAGDLIGVHRGRPAVPPRAARPDGQRAAARGHRRAAQQDTALWTRPAHQAARPHRIRAGAPRDPRRARGQRSGANRGRDAPTHRPRARAVGARRLLGSGPIGLGSDASYPPRRREERDARFRGHIRTGPTVA